MSDTPTRPFGYISGVLDVFNGLMYVSSETALASGAYPVNLVVVSGAMQSMKLLIYALKERADAAEHRSA